VLEGEFLLTGGNCGCFGERWVRLSMRRGGGGEWW